MSAKMQARLVHCAKADAPMAVVHQDKCIYLNSLQYLNLLLVDYQCYTL